LRKIGIVLVSAVTFLSAPLQAADKKVATQQEESFMLGRVVSAVTDSAGGYTKEALSKFKSINRDLQKRQYSQRLNWQAHYWYGKTLVDANKKELAIPLLETAQKEAESLGEEEQRKTKSELLRAQM
jgi:hypothetical protein